MPPPRCQWGRALWMRRTRLVARSGRARPPSGSLGAEPAAPNVDRGGLRAVGRRARQAGAGRGRGGARARRRVARGVGGVPRRLRHRAPCRALPSPSAAPLLHVAPLLLRVRRAAGRPRRRDRRVDLPHHALAVGQGRAGRRRVRADGAASRGCASGCTTRTRTRRRGRLRVNSSSTTGTPRRRQRVGVPARRALPRHGRTAPLAGAGGDVAAAARCRGGRSSAGLRQPQRCAGHGPRSCA